MKSRSAFPAAPQGRFRRSRPRPTGPSDDTHEGASLTVSQIPNRTPSASSLFDGYRFSRVVPRRKRVSRMSRPRKYTHELLERGIRVVLESGRPIAHIAWDRSARVVSQVCGCGSVWSFAGKWSYRERPMGIRPRRLRLWGIRPHDGGQWASGPWRESDPAFDLRGGPASAGTPTILRTG